MKKLFLIVLLYLFSINLNAQDTSFTFDDTTFILGATNIIEAVEYTNELYKYYFNTDKIDELALFLILNSGLKIEIICNTDYDDSPLLSMMVTSDQATDIKMYLVKQGVKGTRIETYGNGNMNPVIHENEMVYMDENGIKDANKKNRRIEIKIIENMPMITKKPSKGIQSYPSRF